ncbi:SagB/ThcOx family dehydrogenase [Parafrankia sp. FMc6]|uniref:SagB/ThcOx family dehydrogenase n=1 Tax=Parafrankia soli TaxID=2599596 RepID=UPI0034D55071
MDSRATSDTDRPALDPTPTAPALTGLAPAALTPADRALITAMGTHAAADGPPLRVLDVIHRNLTAPAGELDLPSTDDSDEVSLVKEYGGAPAVELPRPGGRAGLPPLNRVIADRHSCYAYDDRPLGLADLGDLLHHAAGVKQLAQTPIGSIPVRMAPSAGSLQPVNVYVAASRVDDLEPGVYYYQPVRHELELVSPGDPGPSLTSGCMQDFVGTCAATLVLTCSLDRVVWHYGHRAYRSVHLDAGVLAQNLMLVGTALDLATCAVFGFFDDDLNRLVGADGRDEITALALAVGHPAAAAD